MNATIPQRLRDLLARLRPSYDDGHRHVLVAKHYLAARKFDALGMRERAAVVAGAVLLVLAIWDGLVMQGLYVRERAARAQLELISPSESGGQTTGNLPDLLEAERKLSADHEQRRRELERGVATLIDPARMPDVLTDLIASSNDLVLEKIASLPVEELRASQPAAEPTAEELTTEAEESIEPQALRIPAVAYVHGIEIIVAGDYGAIQSYLQSLEKQPWRFIWRKLELDATEHPKIRAKINVATLGLDRYWLSL